VNVVVDAAAKANNLKEQGLKVNKKSEQLDFSIY